MEEKHIKQESERFVMIGTKVRPDFAERFYQICLNKGFDGPYRPLQMMVDAFVRYTDDRHNLSLEMEQLMAVFEHMNGWKDAFNLADPTPERNIEEAVYFLTGKNRNGARAVMVQRPFFGNWSETVNLQRIFERTLEVLFPERYRRLRAIAVEMDCSSLLELLDLFIDAHTIELLNKEFRDAFTDNNRHEFGRPIEYGQRTKRKHRKTVDGIQTRLGFHDESETNDHPTPDSMEDENGFKPIGGEW